MTDILKDIFLYDPARPMIFTRSFFWGFFLVVFIGFSLVYRQKTLRNAYLFLVSLFFYYKTGGLFLFILIFSTITDFYLGKAIYHSANDKARKLLLALSLIINLSVLVFFKYDYFLTETFNNILNTNFEVVTHSAKWSNAFLGTHFSIDRILPPVGISFFTFQAISYVMDVYRGHVKPVDKITDYGFYISFFPQLVAGPIVRASEFIPQLYKPYELSHADFGKALFIILKGLFKKIFIGDYIAVNLIDRIFANPGSYTGFENLLGLYGYSLRFIATFRAIPILLSAWLC
jgi:D-alanyl-lipoteichoic acid acyltransferase DltB (MBOAT superfamily)